MKDVVVIQNLQKQGFDFQDVDRMLMYEAVERKPRVWDKEPRRVTLKRAKETPTFGCKQEFIIMYNNLLEGTAGELFTIDLGSVRRTCDKQVFVVLQTLIRQSVNYNKSIAENCYELFRIICTIPEDVITIKRVYNALLTTKGMDYWGKQLLEAVRACLFGENPMALYWDAICEFTGLYKECYTRGRDFVVAHFETEKEINTFVRNNYKEAKADKAFMDNTYTDGISKPLIAMLYVLGKDMPEVLKVDDNSDWGNSR